METNTTMNENLFLWKGQISAEQLQKLPLPSAEDLEVSLGKVTVFHVTVSAPGGTLAGVGDLHADLADGGLNGGGNSLAQGLGEVPFVVGGFNGLGGVELNIETALAGADDGDGELEHAGEETTKPEGGARE